MKDDPLLELIEAIRSIPPRYLPLAYNLGCPYCKSVLYDTVNSPVEHVREVKCYNCKGIFYFDNRKRFTPCQQDISISVTITEEDLESKEGTSIIPTMEKKTEVRMTAEAVKTEE